jgi:hypothetical protein
MRRRRNVRENGLSLVLLGLFVVFLVGEALTGHAVDNQKRREEGRPRQSLVEYLRGAEFLSVTMENWESEFLQMAAYVVFTVFLFQRGSSESKRIGHREEVDRDPRPDRADAPWPVRRGGAALAFYQNSLSLAFTLLFVASFALHATGSLRAAREERLEKGQTPVSAREHLTGPKFWFESFQNWQSEFLAIASMVLLSIWLRQKGSPESKPVDAAHHETGE